MARRGTNKLAAACGCYVLLCGAMCCFRLSRLLSWLLLLLLPLLLLLLLQFQQQTVTVLESSRPLHRLRAPSAVRQGGGGRGGSRERGGGGEEELCCNKQARLYGYCV